MEDVLKIHRQHRKSMVFLGEHFFPMKGIFQAANSLIIFLRWEEFPALRRTFFFLIFLLLRKILLPWLLVLYGVLTHTQLSHQTLSDEQKPGLTGRTHQIRAHFAHLGRPLMGDKLYVPWAVVGEDMELRWVECWGFLFVIFLTFFFDWSKVKRYIHRSTDRYCIPYSGVCPSCWGVFWQLYYIW